MGVTVYPPPTTEHVQSTTSPPSPYWQLPNARSNLTHPNGEESFLQTNTVNGSCIPFHALWPSHPVTVWSKVRDNPWFLMISPFQHFRTTFSRVPLRTKLWTEIGFRRWFMVQRGAVLVPIASCEKMKSGMNEWMNLNQSMNQWMNQSMNESINQTYFDVREFFAHNRCYQNKLIND